MLTTGKETSIANYVYEGEIIHAEPEVGYLEPFVSEFDVSYILSALENIPNSLLLKSLYQGRDGSLEITPKGFAYEEIPRELPPTEHGIVVLAKSHISDAIDFEGATILQLRNMDVYESNSTYGEKGIDNMDPIRVKKIRLEEANDANLQFGNNIRFIHMKNGQQFPDFDLVSHLDQLTDAYVDEFKLLVPRVVITHASALDHPDHFITQLAAKRALRRLALEPDWEKPSVYASDAEFGYASGSQEWVDKINVVMQSRRSKISPISYAEKPSLLVQDLLIDATPVMHMKLEGLYLHRSQMLRQQEINGEISAANGVKPYALLIPALARIRASHRGLPKRVKWVEAFRWDRDPSYASGENRLPQYLPKGSVFQLRKTA